MGEKERKLFWSLPAAFAVWYAFILLKTYPGSLQVLRQGFDFFLLPDFAGPRVVGLGSLAGRYALDLLSLAAIAIAAHGFGAAILRRHIREEPGGLERLLLSQGLGLGAIVLGVFGLGVLGLLNPAAALILLSLGAVLAARELRAALKSGGAKGSPERESFFASLSLLERILLALSAYAFLLHLVGALAPETFYDSWVYHLAIPNLYINAGRIVGQPQLLHANFPQNMELLYLLGLLFRGETAAKLLHLWMFALSTAALYEMGRSFSSRRTGLIALTLYCSIPVVSVAAWRTAVEHGAAFWSLLGAWTLIRGLHALEEDKTETEERHWLFLSGCLFGFSMGTKYTAVWAAGAATAVLAYFLFRTERSGPEKLKLFLSWSLPAAALVLPWLYKNHQLLGNPFYPFLGEFFGTAGDVDIIGFEQSARGHFWYGGLLSWKTWLLTPWKLFREGRSTFSFIGPVLVAFFPLVFAARRARFPLGIVLALFGLQYAAWSASSSMVRLLIPALPLFCLYAADRLDALGKEWRGWAPWMAVPLAVWTISWNATMLNQLDCPGPVFGYETRETFFKRKHHDYPNSYAGLIPAIEREVPKNSTILLVGDSRSYMLPRKAVASSVYDRGLFMKTVEESSSPTELSQSLIRLGVSHLLINHGEAHRLMKSKLHRLSKKRLRMLTRFLHSWTEIAAADGRPPVHLLKLRSEPAPRRPAIASPEQLPELIKIALRGHPALDDKTDAERASLVYYIAH